MRGLGWWMGWLVMSAAACGGVTRNEGAGGNVAGRGNDTAVEECGHGPKDLAEYCRGYPCPEGPDDVDLGLCNVANRFARVVRYESSCGGVSVSRNGGLGGDTLHFDANGRLIGIAWFSDVASDCPNTLGRQCTPQGPETNLCEVERCDALDLNYWCSEPDACAGFDSPQMIQQLCDGSDGVERFASSCNGYIFRHQSDTESSEWSFDDTGKLLGVAVTKGAAESCVGGVGYSKVAVYGKPCEAVGEGVDQCGAGGQGGAAGRGAGGQGGAP